MSTYEQYQNRIIRLREEALRLEGLSRRTYPERHHKDDQVVCASGLTATERKASAPDEKCEMGTPFYAEIQANPQYFRKPSGRIYGPDPSNGSATYKLLSDDDAAEKKVKDERSTKLADPEEFFTTLGMEFSYLLDIDKRNPFSSAYRDKSKRADSDSSRVQGLVYSIEGDFEDLPPKLRPYKVNNDEGAIEISSPALFSLEHAEMFWRALTGIAEHYPVKTHRDDTYSGGGHIHLAIPDEVKKDTLFLTAFLTNLFRDVTNRPYLNWIFNEWCDIQSAKSYASATWMKTISTGKDARDKALSHFLWNDVEIPMTLRERHITAIFDGPKGFACRLDHTDSWDDKPSTVEFRFFDMVTSWPELKAHLKFANQYLRYIYSKTKEAKMVICSVTDEKQIAHFAHKDRGLSEFKELLKELGLEYGDYDTFVRKNYRKRKSEGLLK